MVRSWRNFKFGTDGCLSLRGRSVEKCPVNSTTEVHRPVKRPKRHRKGPSVERPRTVFRSMSARHRSSGSRPRRRSLQTLGTPVVPVKPPTSAREGGVPTESGRSRVDSRHETTGQKRLSKESRVTLTIFTKNRTENSLWSSSSTFTLRPQKFS